MSMSADLHIDGAVTEDAIDVDGMKHADGSLSVTVTVALEDHSEGVTVFATVPQLRFIHRHLGDLLDALDPEGGS